MPNENSTTWVNTPDVPNTDVEILDKMAERRGWSRAAMVRHILAQTAARERAIAERKAAQTALVVP